MKVNKVSLELKFSREMRDGVWRGIQLGAEASINEGETLAMGMEALYEELQVQGSVLWGRWHKGGAQRAVGDEEIEELPAPARRAKKVDPLMAAALEMGGQETPEPPTPPADASWCAVHKAKMKMRSWGGYSHQVGDQWCQGHWCSQHGQPFKKFEKGGGVWWSHSYEDPNTGEALWCREDGEQEDIQS